jgi:hypothetical protein
MAAATDAPPRDLTPRATAVVPLNTARLLRVELRHNAMPWVLPLVAALFWFDSYRPSTATMPLYGLRTFWNMGQGHTIIDFGPFVAAVAAWMGSRDGRRGLADLIATTSRARWTAKLATWAATAIWAVGSYLVFVCVMFAVYGHEGVKGAPPWWWVAVGATAVIAFSAVGFAIGVYWPSRFAAPVAAFVGFLAMVMSSQTGFGQTHGWALILPTNSNSNFNGSAGADSGVFYPWLPDLPIARIMFLSGIAIAALGLTGLPIRAGGPWLRRITAVGAFAGVALAATSIALVNSATPSARGVVISALHDAADDSPISYTPACSSAAGVPVCLNPAYRRWLPDVTTALTPVLAEVAGLPGAPVSAAQVSAGYSGSDIDAPQKSMTLGGQPPTLRMSLGILNLPGPNGFGVGTVATDMFAHQLQLLVVNAFVGVADGSGTAAQQAVRAALLQDVGIPFAAQPDLADSLRNTPGPKPQPATGPIYAAAGKLAALPAATQHAWLGAHLGALRTGQLTLGELP